ncbi:iron complex transport system permease protein [Flexibacter flexilis DSM 6793]|uniref:Iron complex transport system permease protein n=1 Tax=Flexibacter flexilis DSM 6793 TaxID=927664 RepID=A0A1I1KYV3_9BACT|nr:iron ABC transporter permease [Flexibacter flexilis]SFC63888.1 iron complex transport system permease protein [Flexibacter flexilis DSM 6793]
MLLAVATLAVLYVGLHVGSFSTDFRTLWQIVQHYDSTDSAQLAIIELRLPRMLMALLSGGTLALSGYLLQILINNPLTDSYTLGASSGASLGINIAYLGAIPMSFAGLYLPILAAFVGALGVTLLVVAIARNHQSVSQLLLAGITISALANSFISLISYLSDSDGKIRNIIYWTMGSFENARWSYLPSLAIALAVSIVLFIIYQKHLFVLMLGQSRAGHLGLSVRQLRRIILISATLLTALAVAFSGTIGFVGLIIPHFIRSLLGANGKYNALWVAWTGGLFLMACDVISRMLYPPAGLPIGIITSFVGIPFFVYLLLKRKSSF